MGRRLINESWTLAAKLQLSPSAAATAATPPPWNSQDDELQLLHDKNYFLHGQVIALTSISVFLIFLLFLVVPCLRRALTLPSSASTDTNSESTKNRNCLLLMPKKTKLANDHHPWPPESFEDEKNSGFQQPCFRNQNCS